MQTIQEERAQEYAIGVIEDSYNPYLIGEDDDDLGFNDGNN